MHASLFVSSPSTVPGIPDQKGVVHPVALTPLHALVLFRHCEDAGAHGADIGCQSPLRLAINGRFNRCCASTVAGIGGSAARWTSGRARYRDLPQPGMMVSTRTHECCEGDD